MKKPFKILLLVVIITTFFSCSENEEKDEPSPAPANTLVSFEFASKDLARDAEPLNINFTFDRPASVSGSFTVQLSGTAEVSSDYTTAPEAQSGVITVNISKGQTEAYVTVTP